MSVRTVYATNNGMDLGGPGGVNAHGCAVAIGAGPDSQYSVNVFRDGGYGLGEYAKVDREDLRAIRDAITAELDR